MFNKIRIIIKNNLGISGLHDRLQDIQQAIARIEIRQINSRSLKLNEAEFKVFSQRGQDGIIQFLINNIIIKNKKFIEFGVETYIEANTRFLLLNNSWDGLVFDGSLDNINYIKNDLPIYWCNQLTAEQSFITKDNINDLIISKGYEGEIGLLSIDIDGNDYWVWESINCVKPCIVICEYNALFGYKKEVVVPYTENFQRRDAHYSQIYYGASLGALNALAIKKGYSLVGTDSSGTDVFFVRNDLVKNLTVLSVEEAYHISQIRESLDKNGKLNFANQHQSLSSIQDLSLVDIETNKLIKAKELI
jgi:hypothetical protein